MRFDTPTTRERESLTAASGELRSDPTLSVLGEVGPWRRLSLIGSNAAREWGMNAQRAMIGGQLSKEPHHWTARGGSSRDLRAPRTVSKPFLLPESSRGACIVRFLALHGADVWKTGWSTVRLSVPCDGWAIGLFPWLRMEVWSAAEGERLMPNCILQLHSLVAVVL